ncbi:MAG: hypothetical protein ACLVKO_01395 [Dysgonomonas sp.]
MVLFISLLFVQCNSKDKATDKMLAETVKMMNERCPMNVDALTRLDSCASEKGKKIKYYYTILNDSLFDVEQFKEIGVPNIKETLKTNPQMEIFRQNDVSITYQYSSLNGKVLYSLELAPSDYK